MSEFNPLVSIVVPVYNGSNFLREALNSALAQTYKNLEIIVVNDGSTDDTEKIALSYGDRIRYFYKENGGTSTALNLGIQNMKGEYFSWLSHDDLYYPNKIAREVEELAKLEDKNTIVISDLDGMTDYTRTFPTALYQEHRDAYPSRNESYLYPVIYNKTHGCTHLIPKKVFETVGMFDVNELVAHDFEFYYRAFSKFPHVYVNEPLITARDSSNRQGKRSHARGNIEYSLLYIDILDHLNDEDILQIAPSIAEFYNDMEDFFYYADYSIALDYVEVIAQDRGIATRYGRRSFVQQISGQDTEQAAVASESAAPTESVPTPAEAAPISVDRPKFMTRVRNAIKRHGLLGFLKLAIKRCLGIH